MKIAGLLLTIGMAVIPSIAAAVPVRPSVFKVMQPDGKRLELTVTGDESSRVTRTVDGLAVVRDDSGVWRYAIPSYDGTPIPGRMIAHDRNDRSISEQRSIAGIDQTIFLNSVFNAKPGLSGMSAARAASASPGDYALTHFSRTGSPKVLVVLVEFPDKRFSKDTRTIYSIYNEMYNGHGYHDTICYKDNTIYNNSGSVREYFESQSYGVFSPSFDIVGPLMADNGYAYYGRNSNRTTNSDSQNAQVLVKELCEKIASNNVVNFSDYDSDGDGCVDMMAVIYAGRGENYAGADENTIWPQNWSLSVKYRNIYSINYFLTCELFWDSEDIIDGIGVFCHEFSHTLGLPDYYYGSDVSGNNDSNASIGCWSIMDYGVYANEGFTPVGYTAFERFSLGWLPLTEISRAGSYTIQELNGGKGNAYRLPSSTDDNAYFILEFHARKGWYKYQAASGLMVTAVNYDSRRWTSRNVNMSPSSKCYYIIPADNDYSRKTSPGDLFPYKGKDSLTISSIPALTIGKSYHSDFNIYGIGLKDSDMVFTIASECPTPVLPVATHGSTEIFDLAGRRQDFAEDDMPQGIWIVVKDGRTRKVQVR